MNKFLAQTKYKVFLLDRYSLYQGDGADLIKQRMNDAIIMIDCKGGLILDVEEEMCFIEMEQDKIEVYE